MKPHRAARGLSFAMAVAALILLAGSVQASQPPDDASIPVEPMRSYSPGARYYGAIDPYPIGYYPYAYYQGSAFPVTRAIGYYPYPDAHPYAPAFPYPYGLYGYGFWGWPYGYGYPGWGWGTVFPYGAWP